ncbi:MAG: serine/threonine-protein kinase [Planctomycetota bacterium]
MSIDRDRRAFEIFDEICDLDPDAQAAAVDRLCEHNPSLREAVQQMLREDSKDDDIALEPGRGAEVLAADLLDASETRAPTRIGEYHVLREIGRGGMGVVYEAEQQYPRRRVAVKVVLPGIASQEVMRRFRREADVLGRLEHPGIARIYGAASAMIRGDRTPYYAMEHIDGMALDRDASERGLSHRQRIELVARVCDAVHHAHQRGVIHRDLKPNNILVHNPEHGAGSTNSREDLRGLGQPKVLDFGIARLIEGSRTSATVNTANGVLLGTLAYMSPEQLLGHQDDLDTRTDVYSLGVILYSLLAGAPPLDVTGRPITEAARAVAEDEPPRLGTVVPALRGDVETIVAKAIDKDRERRYSSAAEFAEDLRRYLRGDPVLAHPPSTFYQLRKFAQRNRTLVTGMGATTAMLIAGLVTTAVLLGRVADQRDAAQIATARSDRVSQFQARLLMQMDVDDLGRDLERIITDEYARTLKSSESNSSDPPPFHPEGVLGSVNPTNLARALISDAIVGRATRLADASYSDDPAVEADIRVGLGDILRELGRYEDAVAQLERAAEQHHTSRGPTHQKTVSTELQLANWYLGAERFEDVAMLIENDLLDRCTRTYGETHRYTIRAASRLSRSYRGMARMEDADRLGRDALRRARKNGDRQLIRRCLNELGSLAVYAKDPDRALRYFDEYFALAATDGIDESSSETITALNNLMTSMFKAGRIVDAERMARRSVALFATEYGDEHPRSIMARNNHARVLLDLGHLDEAESILAAYYETSLRLLKSSSEIRQSLSTNYIDALLASGRAPEAEIVAEALLVDRRDERDPRAAAIAQTLEQLGLCRLAQGKSPDAEAVFAECLALRESINADHWLTHRARSLLGLAIAYQGRLEEAKPMVTGGTEAILRLEEQIAKNMRARELANAELRVTEFKNLSSRRDAP